MANRHRNQNYGRGSENRRNYGNRSSEYDRKGYRGSDYRQERQGSRYGQGSYGSESGGFGDDFSSYDRQENYFGSGRQQFGHVYTGTGSERGLGSYNRDYEEDYTTGLNQGNRGYSGTQRGRDYDRENYGGSYSGQGYSSRRGGYEGGDYEDYGEARGGYSSRGRYDSDDYYNQDSSNAYGGGGTYGGYANRGYSRGMRRGGDFDRESYGGGEREGRYNQEDRGWLERAGDEVASWFGYGEGENREGQHRGRGPRNYKRSDDRIKEDINDHLTDNDYLDASDIEVEVNNSEVILTGTVGSRYAKRLAEDIAEDVSGVTHVENRIRINQNYYGQGQGSSYSMGASETTSETSSTTGTTGSTGTSATTTSGTTGTAGTTGATTDTSETTGTTGTTGGKSRSKTA